MRDQGESEFEIVASDIVIKQSMPCLRWITAPTVYLFGELRLGKMKNLVNGVDLCLRNAENLIKDAELLLEHESYGHATSLVYLGLEELAKALRLSELYFTNEDSEDLIDIFRSHETKLALFAGAISGPALGEAFRTYTQGGPLTMESIQKFLHAIEFGSHLTREIQEANEQKKVGFYVDYRDEKWHSPFDIGRQKAKSLVDLGKQSLADIGSMCKWLVEFAPLRDKFYSEVLKPSLKKALDDGIISQELYNAMSSMLKDS